MKPLYTSELTNFLTQLKQEKPHLTQEQLTGRQLLWEKHNSLQQEELNQTLAKNKVKHKGYTYF
jgi:hypothetical protein